MIEASYDKLSTPQKRLLEEAERARKRSYCPYSGFRVGAAVWTTTGMIIMGSNFENAAYGSTICAERAAIFSANASGYRISAIAVIGRGKEPGPIGKVVAPCGACRQVIFEASQISGCDIQVIMPDAEMRIIKIATISELLPLAFGPADLGIDLEKK